MFFYLVLVGRQNLPLLIKVLKSYLGMTSVWRYLGSYLVLRVHILGVHILRIVLDAKGFLALSGGNCSRTLNISFLSGACPPACYSLLI